MAISRDRAGHLVENVATEYIAHDTLTLSTDVAEKISLPESTVQIIIQNRSSSTGNVYVGGASIASGEGIELIPGASVVLQLTDVAFVYVIRETGLAATVGILGGR